MARREIQGSGEGGIKPISWTTIGQRVAGRLVAVKNGKVFNGRQSRLAMIDQGDGNPPIPVPLTSDLADDKQFERNVRPGDYVEITLKELIKGKQPQPYKKFSLVIDDGAPAGAPTPAASAQPLAAGGDYDALSAKLVERVGAVPATSMLNALRDMYSDPAVRLEELKKTLRLQGVTV